MADADVQRMLADLGLDRRDYVSAPEEDPRSRLVRDSDAQRHALDEFEARQKYIRENAPTGNAKAAKLQAWNTATTFARDEVSEHLENRFSGQGHRAALQQQLHGGPSYDKQREALEARYGEERRLHLQQREQDTHGRGNYVASTPQQRSRVHATPRAFSGGHQPARQADRGRLTARAPANTTRAPSLRSFSTVRFGPGGGRVAQSGSANTRNPTQQNTPRPAFAAATGNRAGAHVHTNGTAPAALNLFPTANSRSPSPASITSTVTDSDVERLKMMATFYAERPDADRDAHYEKYPDRKPYFKEAQMKLIKQAFAHADNPHSEEVEDYLTSHPQRKWILQAALKAKEFVESGKTKEAEAYYATRHPDEGLIYRGALKRWEPTTASSASTPAVTAPNRNAETSAAAGLPTPPPPATNAPPTSAPSATSQSKATTHAHPPAPSAPTPTAAPKQETKPTTPQVDVPATQQIPRVLPGTFPDAEMDSTSIRDSIRELIQRPKTKATMQAPATKQKKLGTLSAIYRSDCNAFIAEESFPIAPPVHADLTLTSLQKGYDTRELSAQAGAFAKSLTTRWLASNGEKQAVADRVGDSAQTDDGVWVDKGDADPEIAKLQAGLKKCENVKKVGTMKEADDGVWGDSDEEL